MDDGRSIESLAERRTRARSLAGFFAAGAVLSVAVLSLPGWEQVDAGGIGVTVALASVSAAALALFPHLFSRAACHGVTVSGTLLIGACQVFAQGGSPTAMYAMLYIWVILQCSLFCSRWAVITYLAFTTAVHATTLVWLGDVSSIAPQLTLTLGTQAAAAIVVGSLVTRQRELADTDALTGLGNRRVVDRELARAWVRSRRTQRSVHVAVLDLDGFKAFNDQQGHAAGDLVLRDVAETWRRVIRPTDTLTRTGGDEFLLMLLDCGQVEAEAIVRRMTERIPEDVRCSAGLAHRQVGDTPQTLIERADRALYEAKADAASVVAAAPEAAPAMGAEEDTTTEAGNGSGAVSTDAVVR